MVTEKKSGNGLLDGFSLDDGEEFFGIKTENEDDNLPSKVKSSDLGDDEDDEDESTTPIGDKKVVSKKKEAKKEKEEDEEEDDFEFGETEKTKEKKVEKAEKTEKVDKIDKKDIEEKKDIEDDPDDFFTNLATDLKEKGILSNVEIPTDKTLTEEEFFKLHDDEIESRVTETFEALFEELGEEGSNFLKYIKDGGNPRAFLTQVTRRFSLDELDTDNDGQVNKTLAHYFTTYEKTDEEDIADKIKWLEDSGKKKAYAAKYFKIIKDGEKQEEANMLKQQEAVIKNKQIEVKEFNNSLKSIASNIESVGSLPISKQDQKELPDYIIKPTVKVGKNNFIPEFHNELGRILRGKTNKDKEQLLALAKVIKGGFELPAMETALETKVTSRAKSRISDKRNSIKNISSGSRERSLADVMT